MRGHEWPISEPMIYRYLVETCGDESLTSAQRCIEVISFMKHILGADGVDQILDSRRITGFARERLAMMPDLLKLFLIPTRAN